MIDSVATLFASSPWIHIGGDEVREGAWEGSPIVAEYRSTHGLRTVGEVEGAFHRQLATIVPALSPVSLRELETSASDAPRLRIANTTSGETVEIDAADWLACVFGDGDPNASPGRTTFFSVRHIT